MTFHCLDKGRLLHRRNGSGKSTLVKLLGKLYTMIRVRLPLIHTCAHSLIMRNSEVKCFSFRILRNIFECGREYQFRFKETINIERLQQPLQNSGASTFIENEARFDSKLGRTFWMGEQLSGGEWQRSFSPFVLSRC
jgi:ATP-binding cassette subfamily B protein